MKTVNGINFRAVLIALFAFYIAPILPLTVLTSAPNFFGTPEPVGERIPLWHSAGSLLLLWFWALAPVGSGYLFSEAGPTAAAPSRPHNRSNRCGAGLALGSRKLGI